ncbi:hypothetical protein FN846DRAFT_893046 [Sphaerosporella brunnea]|uniref:Uncharacterized protein n=1 Tax=Sphaerosporella brunnea TaxID=1250544 RepID=A0A5J5END6_9PEZI|nr:hypothetical protein FN846DRAFT_893046 [Sphaerosporella brunnea]
MGADYDAKLQSSETRSTPLVETHCWLIAPLCDLAEDGQGLGSWKEQVSYLFQLDKFIPILDNQYPDELSAGMAVGQEGVQGNAPYTPEPNLDVYCVISARRDGRVYDIAVGSRSSVGSQFKKSKTSPGLDGAVKLPFLDLVSRSVGYLREPFARGAGRVLGPCLVRTKARTILGSAMAKHAKKETNAIPKPKPKKPFSTSSEDDEHASSKENAKISIAWDFTVRGFLLMELFARGTGHSTYLQDQYAKIRWKTKDLETWEALGYAWLFSAANIRGL